MHPNTTKTHQNMSLGSNGVDLVRSLPEIPMRVRGSNFCNNCTSSAYFAPSFMQQRNNTKCTQTLQNAPILEFSIQWGGSGVFIAKNYDAMSWHELIAQVQPILQRVPCSNETLPNAPKHYKMLQNMSLVPMGWIECVLCEKFRCDFMAQTCALIAPVQPVLHRVDKCIQT